MNRLKKLLGIFLIVPLLGLALAGCRSESLALQITSPLMWGAEVTEGMVTVTGIVSPAPAKVTVNGIEVETGWDGAFSVDVELPYGRNTVEVTAIAGDLEPVTRTITVTRILALELTSPEDKAEVTESPVTVSGKVSDPLAKVTVNGVETIIDEDGSFSRNVELTYVKNTITAVATVEGHEPVTRTVTVERVLHVEITSPGYWVEVTESPVTVSGIVRPPSARVMLNGIEVETAEDGTFSLDIELTPGENAIVVKAIEPVTRTLTIVYKEAAEAEARSLAEEFVRNSPTFVFDGIEETLNLVETLYRDIENGWTFVFHFESRHAGYGDRTGQVLAEVITPHEAVITVEQGEVKSALMDEKWDMLTQQMVEEE